MLLLAIILIHITAGQDAEFDEATCNGDIISLAPGNSTKHVFPIDLSDINSPQIQELPWTMTNLPAGYEKGNVVESTAVQPGTGNIYIVYSLHTEGCTGAYPTCDLTRALGIYDDATQNIQFIGFVNDPSDPGFDPKYISSITFDCAGNLWGIGDVEVDKKIYEFNIHTGEAKSFENIITPECHQGVSGGECISTIAYNWDTNLFYRISTNEAILAINNDPHVLTIREADGTDTHFDINDPNNFCQTIWEFEYIGDDLWIISCSNLQISPTPSITWSLRLLDTSNSLTNPIILPIGTNGIILPAISQGIISGNENNDICVPPTDSECGRGGFPGIEPPSLAPSSQPSNSPTSSTKPPTSSTKPPTQLPTQSTKPPTHLPTQTPDSNDKPQLPHVQTQPPDSSDSSDSSDESEDSDDSDDSDEFSIKI